MRIDVTFDRADSLRMAEIVSLVAEYEGLWRSSTLRRQHRLREISHKLNALCDTDTLRAVRGACACAVANVRPNEHDRVIEHCHIADVIDDYIHRPSMIA